MLSRCSRLSGAIKLGPGLRVGDLLVQNLPELEEAGSVQMTFLSTDDHDMNVPLFDVRVQFHLIVLDVETADCFNKQNK